MNIPEMSLEDQAMVNEICGTVLDVEKTLKTINTTVNVVKIVEGTAVSAMAFGICKSFCPKNAPWYTKLMFVVGAYTAGSVVAHMNDKRIDSEVNAIARKLVEMTGDEE